MIQAYQLTQNNIMETSFVCSCCKETKPVQSSGGTGYGTLPNGDKVCYACCALHDEKEMKETGKLTGYLVLRGDGYYFTNWPGSLSFKVRNHRYSWHNFAGKNGRIDFWFTAYGKEWHGVQIGQHNQIARVKATKG